MNTLTLKPTHKAVLSYYSQLRTFKGLNVANEGTLAPLFGELLKHCARQFQWNLLEQHTIRVYGKAIRADGALFDKYNLRHGIWEAKDSDDNLEKEVRRKFEAGYPSDNILFQAPERIIIIQNGREVFNDKITNPQFLIRALKIFFEEYQPEELLKWEKAAEEFKDRVPEIGQRLLKQIETERERNRVFTGAFNDFFSLCRETINPELSVKAVEEMLIQHILTERIFRNVFRNADFVNRNIIAREIEKVVTALTSQHFSRDEFLSDLDLFYKAIETTADTIADYSQKQHFLNTIYEKFFQGFSVKVADTHGIVYTPQPIVDFMVRSVEEILRKEFDKSLSDEGVHILDPFVGTGNFIIRVMREIKRHKLLYKYEKELHCNEVMLLPYYIASMNIEHAFFEMAGNYLPFEGICLVDTFEIAEGQQTSHLDALFSRENTARVRRQKESPIFVILGNPPYNAGQVNENDNNKNRKYTGIDKRVTDTYARDSNATLLRKLSDPYIKAFRLASDRIGNEGIVAFVSNNSFVSDLSFDGMRKNLAADFDEIYILDLGGNVRKNPKLSGTTHNVFGIQVGVSINILVRRKDKSKVRKAEIYYASVGEFWKKEEKYDFLEKKEMHENIKWEKIKPDTRNQWLTDGIEDKFDTFIGIGSKEAKRGKDSKVKFIFKTYSLGVSTNRDSVVYDFKEDNLSNRIRHFCELYNTEVQRLKGISAKENIDVIVDYSKIQWSSTLKNHLKQQAIANFINCLIRISLYRPFTKQYLYYDPVLIDRPALFSEIFPNTDKENKNRIISTSGISSNKPFHCLMTNIIPDLHLTGDSQCFPFYIYSEDGSNRKENITDWSLAEFRSHYSDKKITKWDIFYYIYAILHHPLYRSKYAANLRRSLPRIPYAPDFSAFAEAGKRLADLHVNYETQKEYKLEFIENAKSKLDWRVEKMRLSKDKTRIVYNDFLTLAGIPAEAFEYRLGNRSALDWIIDQYQVSTDKRSGIVNDPNNPDDPEYIVKLVGKIITVSLETVKIVKDLPSLEAGD
jgi:predicted helicase